MSATEKQDTVPNLAVPVPDARLRRKRKAHTKSRAGCGNCKLRRVKCDEGKPSCKGCKSYGVACAYDRVGADLSAVSEAAFVVRAPQLQVNTMSMSQTFLGMLNDSLKRQVAKDRAWELTNHDLVLLNKFHEHTSATLGTEQTRHIFRAESLKLAFRHSFLMHIALTFTLMHERSDNLHSRQTLRELSHWAQGLSEFQSKLSSDSLTSSERDALWIAAALLGCATLAHVDGTTPEEVWPLKRPTPYDLNWVSMSEGKKEVWRVADLYRPDSTLHAVTTIPPDSFLTSMTDHEALTLLPPEFPELCEITPYTTSASSPYFRLLSIVGRLMPLEPVQANMLRFMTFLGQMPHEFRVLLEKKDPRAMLILLWFSSKVAERLQWWWWKRAMLEGRAMCIYLETCHPDLPHLKKLLEFPKDRCFRDLSPEARSPEGKLSPQKGSGILAGVV